ncbi:hypothetical protein LP419_34945 [Massilia sp. H-1]|nr:hypothetical protein LP419_34945 [Massilia sp. H-1]
MTEMRLVQLIDNPKNALAPNGAPRNAPYDFVARKQQRPHLRRPGHPGLGLEGHRRVRGRGLALQGSHHSAHRRQ